MESSWTTKAADFRGKPGRSPCAADNAPFYQCEKNVKQRLAGRPGQASRIGASKVIQRAITMPDAIVKPGWRPAAFLLLQLCAVLLLASWLWPASRALWDQADHALFHLLNGSLHKNPLWDGAWALASTRLWDVLVAGLMLSLLIRRDWVFAEPQLRPALFTCIALLMVLLVIRTAFSKMADYYDWQHPSPSMVIAGATQLSDHFPMLERFFEVKDRSSNSFPGDHASVLMLWGGFMALFARRGRLLAVLGLTTLCMLPRLVTGAHWFSDDLVGGLLITLLALAWGYCTPLAGQIAAALQWLARPLMGVAARLPVLRRLSLFQRPPRHPGT
jgi:membrane-associated phospholipid phosphatase